MAFRTPFSFLGLKFNAILFFGLKIKTVITASCDDWRVQLPSRMKNQVHQVLFGLMSPTMMLISASLS